MENYSRRIDDLYARLVQLECQNHQLGIRNRQMRCIGVLILVFLGSFLLLGAANPVAEKQENTPTRIKATSFVLVDSQGNTRGEWGIRKENSYFVLCNEKGSHRVMLSYTKEGWGAQLFDNAGNAPTKLMYADRANASFLSLLAKPKRGMLLKCDPQTSSFLVTDAMGRKRLLLQSKDTEKNESHNLSFFDKDKKLRMALGILDEKTHGLILSGQEPIPLLTVYSKPGEHGIGMNDKAGKDRATLRLKGNALEIYVKNKKGELLPMFK